MTGKSFDIGNLVVGVDGSLGSFRASPVFAEGVMPYVQMVRAAAHMRTCRRLFCLYRNFGCNKRKYVRQLQSQHYHKTAYTSEPGLTLYADYSLDKFNAWEIKSKHLDQELKNYKIG